MSSVVLTWGPSAVITRNLASGSLSPTLMVIVNLHEGVGVIRPGRRPAQYWAPRKRQWPSWITVLSLPRKPAAIEKSLLLRRRRAPEDTIAMRKAPEPADDTGMTLGVFQLVCVAA